MTSRFPDRLRLLPDFEPHPLAADLTAVEKAGWTAHFVKQNRDGEWSAIALRGEKGETHWVRLIYSDPGYRDFADTPLLAATRFLYVAGAGPIRMPIAGGAADAFGAGFAVQRRRGPPPCPGRDQRRGGFPAQRVAPRHAGRLYPCICACRTRAAWPTGAKPRGSIWPSMPRLRGPGWPRCSSGLPVPRAAGRPEPGGTI